MLALLVGQFRGIEYLHLPFYKSMCDHIFRSVWRERDRDEHLRTQVLFPWLCINGMAVLECVQSLTGVSTNGRSREAGMSWWQG